MSPAGKDLAVGLALAALVLPLWAAPPYHALEVEPPNAVLFVDAERSRLLRFDGSRLTVVGDLSGLPNGSQLHNLVRGPGGSLYLGDRRGTWRVDGPGPPEPAATPEALRPLYS